MLLGLSAAFDSMDHAALLQRLRVSYDLDGTSAGSHPTRAVVAAAIYRDVATTRIMSRYRQKVFPLFLNLIQ